MVHRGLSCKLRKICGILNFHIKKRYFSLTLFVLIILTSCETDDKRINQDDQGIAKLVYSYFNINHERLTFKDSIFIINSKNNDNVGLEVDSSKLYFVIDKDSVVLISPYTRRYYTFLDNQKNTTNHLMVFPRSYKEYRIPDYDIFCTEYRELRDYRIGGENFRIERYVTSTKSICPSEMFFLYYLKDVGPLIVIDFYNNKYKKLQRSVNLSFDKSVINSLISKIIADSSFFITNSNNKRIE